MTDVTLADLRVVIRWEDKGDYLDGQPLSERPATRADILAVVKQMGGVERQSRPDDWGVSVVSVDSPGRYLIVPAEEESP
jgi:hypothetical protein